MKPPVFYELITDKQRVVLVGEAKGLSDLIRHILTSQRRKFDYAKDDELVATIPNSPVIIIREGRGEYNPHIVAALSLTDAKIFDQLSKGGIIIYNKENTSLAQAAEVERADIQAIGITSAEVERKIQIKNAKALSKEEKIAIGVAHELLKKLGVTPAQFEESLSTFIF